VGKQQEERADAQDFDSKHEDPLTKVTENGN
jgi:hypothetical protein